MECSVVSVNVIVFVIIIIVIIVFVCLVGVSTVCPVCEKTERDRETQLNFIITFNQWSRGQFRSCDNYMWLTLRNCLCTYINTDILVLYICTYYVFIYIYIYIYRVLNMCSSSTRELRLTHYRYNTRIYCSVKQFIIILASELESQSQSAALFLIT